MEDLVRKCHKEREFWKIATGDDISLETISSTLPDNEALLEFIKGS